MNRRAVISLTTLAVALWVMVMEGATVPTLAQEPAPPLSAQETLPWSIHLYAVPTGGLDNTGLTAFTGRTANICQDGKVTFNADRVNIPAPAPFEGEYQADKGIYQGELNKFFPEGTGPHSATLEVVCQLPNGDRRVTNPIVFVRYSYPSNFNVRSDDGGAELTLNSNSLDASHFIIVMFTNALPDPLPTDVQQIGLPYSFRASGSILQSNKNMFLNLFYQNTFLGEADPLTLRIFEWDAAATQWLNNGDQSLSTPVMGQPNINKPATNFTTYTLGSTPLWCDDFTSSAGVETDENVTRISALDFIKLDSNASSGFAISKPYTPTLPLDSWVEVSYDATIPVSTALTVSLLSLTDEVLIPNVSSPQSLAEIDPEQYPGLKLRVDMSTTSVGTTPHLSKWSILAKPVNYEVYLPLVIK